MYGVIRKSCPAVPWNSVKTLTLNFSGSPTNTANDKSWLFFEDNEGSVLGRFMSGDHKMGLTRSPAAETNENKPFYIIELVYY